MVKSMEEKIKNKLIELENLERQLVAQLNAVAGAKQALEDLLKDEKCEVFE